MKTIIEREFGPGYGAIMRGVISRNEIGRFFLTDWKACNECSNVLNYFFRSCNQEVSLQDSSGDTVTIINLEDYFQSFKIPSISEGGNCDCLLYSSRRIVFLDMSCSRAEYLEEHLREGVIVQGKRAKAYSQIEDSINKLLTVPAIASVINGFDVKTALFAFRKKVSAFDTLPGEQKAVAYPMSSFIRFSRIGTRYKVRMANGFVFEMSEYPSVFVW